MTQSQTPDFDALQKGIAAIGECPHCGETFGDEHRPGECPAKERVELGEAAPEDTPK